MPLYLGDMRKDIPYNRAYLGDQIVYDSAIQLDHTLCLYDYGDEGESGGIVQRDIWATDSEDFTNITYTKNADNVEFYGEAPTNNKTSYGGFGTTNAFNFSKYSCIYAKLRTTTVGFETETYLATFRPEHHKIDVADATKSVTFTETSDWQTPYNKVTVENEPNFLVNISDLTYTTEEREICIGVKGSSSAYTPHGGQIGVKMFALYLFKRDNWRTLARIAGLTPTTMAALIQNASTILANEDAVDYMITKCTGDFMINALMNSTFKTALDSSTYKATILANDFWGKFYGIVYDTTFSYNLFPMKWDTTTFGSTYTRTTLNGQWTLVADPAYPTTASDSNVRYEPPVAVRENYSTSFAWKSIQLGSGEYETLTVTMPVKVKPTEIFIKYKVIGPNAVVQGLTTSNTWATLGTLSRIDFDWRETTLTLSGDTYYTAFRIYSDRWNENNQQFQVNQFLVKAGSIDYD